MSVAPSDKPREAFIKAVFALSKHSPSEWSDFLIAFDAYTNEEMAKATITTTENLHISVGMSRQLNRLRSDFNSIEALMGSITALQRKKQERV